MLKIENLTKRYKTPTLEAIGGVSDVSFEVAAGEFYTLLGPSGCGKTTTLRCIAGLEEPVSGRISLGGRDVFSSHKNILIQSSERNIGMVFQSYAVWPHMTVYDNAAFPLKMSRARRYSNSEIKTRVLRILETVGLAAYTARFAAQLSGGQQQRLSLARALVAEPRLLLLDEPLSNLDALLREQMRTELRRLQTEFGVTTVCVTHDQSEALALSDRIAVMRNGEIAQIGTPQEIYYHPISSFVANFVGRTNLIPVISILSNVPSDRVVAETSIGQFECRLASTGRATETKILLAVRPEHVQMSLSSGHIPANTNNKVEGQVLNAVFLGEMTEWLVSTGAGVVILVRSSAENMFSLGDIVHLTFPAEQVVGVFD